LQSKADIRSHVEALRAEAEAGSVAARVALIELSVKLLEAKHG
jgi:hypothetical protein